MKTWWLAGVAAVFLAGSAGADVWDVGSDTDNNNGTDNELTHGTVQVHDLGALPGPVRDEDWYRIYIPAYTSWEVLVDGTTGDICAGGGAGIDVQLFDSDGVTATPFTGTGVSPFQCTSSLRLVSQIINLNTPIQDFVRVRAVDCTTNCDPSDQYTIHTRETTLYAPRFNNSATQVTVCIIQNAGDTNAFADTAFFDTAGNFLYQDAFSIAPHAAHVFNTSAIPQLAGKSGSLVVANEAQYGRMQGKCVAVEPATGFTFDTPMVTRPN